MSANTVRVERVALLLILVSFGIVFKVVATICAAHSALKELVVTGSRHLLGGYRRASRPHSPPA